MSLATWTLIALIATGVCGFTLKGPNPLRGFLPSKLIVVHILLGLTTIGLAAAAIASL